MSRPFDWDELNLLKSEAERLIRKGKPDEKQIDRFCDYMEFVLCLMYAYGWHDAEAIVGPVPFRDTLDDKAVNLEIDGKTFRDRVREQIGLMSLPGLTRIIETEAHRDYNTGVQEAGQRSGVPVRKQWNTMLDGRVRDTHDYLEGAIVGIEDRFYTYDGDSALAPCGFSLPENNINCRCWITLVR